VRKEDRSLSEAGATASFFITPLCGLKIRQNEGVNALTYRHYGSGYSLIHTRDSSTCLTLTSIRVNKNWALVEQMPLIEPQPVTQFVPGMCGFSRETPYTDHRPSSGVQAAAVML
jgi:hypothetical protein